MSSCIVKTIQCDEYNQIEFIRFCDTDENFSFFMILDEGEEKDISIRLSASLIKEIVDGFNKVACFEHAPVNFKVYGPREK